MSHPEIGRVHTQLESVLLTKILKASGQIVNLGHSQRNSTHHLLSMGHNGSGTESRLRPVGEVDLGLRIHRKHPAEIDDRLLVRQLSDSHKIGN